MDEVCPLHEARRVLVGVSGGPDSVALLLLLLDARDASGPTAFPEVLVGHVHHGLRGEEADGDEEFVRALCERLGVEMLLLRGDARSEAAAARLSPEAGARALRFRAFRQWAEDRGIDALLLAHHLDDQAETVVLRAVRGAGIRGLSGIPPRRRFRRRGGVTWVARPLLGWRRAEIIEYLESRGQGWRRDSTNEDPSIPRNRVRRDILPVLESRVQPGAAESLARLARISARTSGDLRLLGLRALREARVPSPAGTLCLDATRLSEWPESVLREALLRALVEVLEARGPAAASQVSPGPGVEPPCVSSPRPPPRLPGSVLRAVARWLGAGGRGAEAIEFGAGGRLLVADLRYGRVRLEVLGRGAAGARPGAAEPRVEPAATESAPVGDIEPEAVGSHLVPGTVVGWLDWEISARTPIARGGARPTSPGVDAAVPAGTPLAPGPLQGASAGAAGVGGSPDERPGAVEEEVDAEAVERAGRLRVRSRLRGDRFWPLGSPGRKSLKEFFRERRVWPRDRDRVPVVVAGETIVWVVGHRIDHRFRVRPETRRVIILRARPRGGA